MRSDIAAGQHNFAMVPRIQIPRSQFSMSFRHLTTFNSGYLIPIMARLALPGDTWNCSANLFGRLATSLVPLMDGLYIETFFFAVPLRILWPNFYKFCGAQDNPGDSTDFVCPTVTSPAGGWTSGSLQDFLGWATAGQITGSNTVTCNNFKGRAYNMIFDYWFRDQNLEDSVGGYGEAAGDGPDTAADYVLLQRCLKQDYFTSSLPFAQKGTAVDIPIGTAAQVKMYPSSVNTNNVNIWQAANTSVASAVGAVAGGPFTPTPLLDGSAVELRIDPNNTLYADLTNATAATINQLRQAFQIQRMLEKDARSGTRFPEMILAHFGVTAPDYRVQFPEFLGGGSQRINSTPIAQTSATSGGGTPQGNLAAFTSFGTQSRPHSFTKSFVEHCVVMCLANVRADVSYQQGMSREDFYSTRYDMPWPTLAQIGEQAVLNQELYATGTSTDTEVWGYQERYAEARYSPSYVSGQYRSTYSTPLDMWHLALKFSSLPTLGSTFIKSNPPLSRNLAVGSGANGQQILLDATFQIKAARPLPSYGVPGNIDRF